jgi:hypothetical protein
MGSAGLVRRFLKPYAVAAIMTVLAACGGGGAPPAPEVVRITVAGMPSAPLAPMQTAQLTASAIYSDGAAQDVTSAATWDSTDRSVLTASPAGLVTATGPGKADVVAVFAGVRGAVTGEVVALPSAYLIGGLEYAFDYQLDAQGRVASYRISQREGVSYPNAPAIDYNLKECTGNLRGSYSCSGINYNPTSMTGEAGRLVAMRGFSSFTYVYGPTELLQFKREMLSGSIHQTASETLALTYDPLGRLSEVSKVCVSNYWGYGGRTEKTARIALDPQGRLLREDVTTIVIPDPYTGETTSCPPDTVAWAYDPAGYMKTAGSTEYTAEAEGWLTSRRRVVGANTVVDTYAITRFGGRVAEEQFTQAEPSAFYTARSDSQRVRYEWGRLPTEPLFVPRALTGLKGADYLGVISSHHR